MCNTGSAWIVCFPGTTSKDRLTGFRGPQAGESDEYALAERTLALFAALAAGGVSGRDDLKVAGAAARAALRAAPLMPESELLNAALAAVGRPPLPPPPRAEVEAREVHSGMLQLGGGHRAKGEEAYLHNLYNLPCIFSLTQEMGDDQIKYVTSEKFYWDAPTERRPLEVPHQGFHTKVDSMTPSHRRVHLRWRMALRWRRGRKRRRRVAERRR